MISAFYVKNSILNNVNKQSIKILKRLMSKTYIIVIRIGGHGHNSVINSRPCQNCINYMKNIGIKKIYYSNEDGNFTGEHITYMESNHLSMAARRLNDLMN